ncbi:MAG: hypothetical protein ACE5IB_05450 [Candidatus Geothermarchaeales archaeon]
MSLLYQIPKYAAIEDIILTAAITVFILLPLLYVIVKQFSKVNVRVRCKSCGHLNEKTARHCSECGEKI